MICKRCEQSYSDALGMCPYCGAPKDSEEPMYPNGNVQQPQVPQGQQYQQMPQQAYAPQGQPYQQNSISAEKGRGAGIGSLVCGIFGLIFCWVPILGLVLNIVALALSGSSRKHGPNGLATAGLVLGIIGVIVSAIVTIVMIFALAVAGTAAMFAAPFL